MVIRGVSPLRGFPVERRGIGHLVLSGQRTRGGVCPSAGCQVGTVVQLVGPAPTLHDKIINVVMCCFPKDLVSVYIAAIIVLTYIPHSILSRRGNDYSKQNSPT